MIDEYRSPFRANILPCNETDLVPLFALLRMAATSVVTRVSVRFKLGAKSFGSDVVRRKASLAVLINSRSSR
jgi:hypothetical protein